MDSQNDSRIIEVFIAFGSAAAGALLGSLSAFYLGKLQQRHDQKEKERSDFLSSQQKKYSTLLQAQYALISQCSTLAFIKLNHLDPYRQNASARHIEMPMFYVPSNY